jgi:hypothetical protein
MCKVKPMSPEIADLADRVETAFHTLPQGGGKTTTLIAALNEAFERGSQEPAKRKAQEQLKKQILDVNNKVCDLVGRFLYYDRKEDDDLPVGKIDELVKAGHITVQDLVTTFETELRSGLQK